MSPPALLDNLAYLPDDKLGEELLILWTNYQVTKRGIHPEDESIDVAEGLLNGTLLMDTDIARDVPLEKALRFSALGEFAKSGSLLRDFLQEKAILVVLEKWAQAGLNFRKDQSKKAKKSRGKVTEDGKTLTQIINKLANSPRYNEYPAKELWTVLLGEINELGIDFEAYGDESYDKDLDRYILIYSTDRLKGRSKTFKSFQNDVSRARKEKESL